MLARPSASWASALSGLLTALLIMERATTTGLQKSSLMLAGLQVVCHATIKRNVATTSVFDFAFW
jgi:hypothetical protein